MNIKVEFIDHKGFWHLETGISKKAVKKLICRLHPQPCIKWLTKNHVHISQQYITEPSGYAVGR